MPMLPPKTAPMTRVGPIRPTGNPRPAAAALVIDLSRATSSNAVRLSCPSMAAFTVS